MNFTIYVFGNLLEGFTQYPQDEYVNTIVTKMVENMSSPSQIVIHREESLIYYAYIRQLDINGGYIGFCIQLNSFAISNVNVLFLMFEILVSKLVEKGKIIQFDNSGRIKPNIANLFEHLDVVDYIEIEITNGVKIQQVILEKLPPIDNSGAGRMVKRFPIGFDEAQITHSSFCNEYIYIEKKTSFNTSRMNQYKNILARLNAENEKLKVENIKLNQKKSKLGYVVALVVIVLCCIVGLVFQDAIINTKEDCINKQKLAYNDSIKNLEEKVKFANKELDLLSASVSTIYPIIIKEIKIGNVDKDSKIQTSYGGRLEEYNTMYLQPRIVYTGLTSGNKTFKIKWYKPDGTISHGVSSPSGFSQSKSVNVLKGENHSFEFSGWGNASPGHWRSGTYRIEIWYENTCLKSKTFTIYKGEK